jgi:polysaccharide biosynthesis/export protein
MLSYFRLQALVILCLISPLVVSLVGCKSTDLDSDLTASHDYPPPQVPAAVATPEAPPQPVVQRRSNNSPVRSGDTLELFVEEDDSFNGTYPVREQGDVIIPSVGRIPVSGMSVSEAGSRIKAKLEASHLKKASVMLDRVGRAPEPEVARVASASGSTGGKQLMTIYMTGKVSRPGQHKVPLPPSGHLGVYEAILIAGGLSQFSDPAKVHLLRTDAEGKKRKIPVNISMIEKGLAKDTAIGEGDIVVVPEKVFGF